MDISKFRKDFPLLNSDDNPTYLDSACMTLRPQVVIDALTDYIPTILHVVVVQYIS